MADSSKKGKKKKGKTLNLNEFLSSGDGKQAATFAKKKAVDIEEDDQHAAYDSEEEIKKEVFDLSALPTAPRASRSAIDPKSLPSGPPYTAFLGNLSYDVEEDDIIEFFGNLKLDKVRLPREGDRLRGFGYAEFVDVDSLVKAIELNNEALKGRRIRVDIAESGGSSEGREDSREDRSTDWRRKDPGDFERRPFERSRDGGRMDRGDGDSPWRSSEADDASTWRRGESFESSRAEPRRYESRGQSDRSWGDSAADSESTWRRGSPNRSDERARFGNRDGDRGGRVGDRGGFDGEADTASSWRSEPSSYRGRETTGQDSRPQLADENPWRRPSSDRTEPQQQPAQEAQRERPKLNLKPRTVVDASKEGSTSTSSIFGGARPVDTATREREIEKKILHSEDTDATKTTQNGSVGSEEPHSDPSVSDRKPSPQAKDVQRQGRVDDAPARNKEGAWRSLGQEGSVGRIESSENKENRNDVDKKGDEPQLPHYEEAKAPVFVQKSIYSVLADEEGSNEED
eukprot:gene14426-5482_t